MEAQHFGPEEGAALLFTLGIVGLVMLISLVPIVLYLCSLQKVLKRCRPENRLMQPGLVWLMLIPLFNLIWHFFIVINIAGSLEKEFADRSQLTEPAPGKSVGLAMCILNACGLVPYLGILTGFGSFICWIIYWIKVADCSAKLVQILPVNPAAYRQV